MKLGIVGLPNVGKSTMFNSITKAGAECANYPFCTIEPNVGVVPVPDERLDELTKMYNPQKTTHAVIEFVDIAGLVKGASKGEGLGNKFLSHIRETDAICEVVRCFNDSNVVHVDGSVDPIRDIETINLELIFADIETVNKRLDKARKNLKADKKYQEEIDLLEKIKEKGVEIANVTLHVGIGTFRPVKEDTVEAHEMHSEHFYIKKEDCDKINKAKQEGRRVIAVGTTSCRVLETIANKENGMVEPQEGDTQIFIYPGYKFKCIDGLITNFHLPQSTLLMLVSALAGKDYIMGAYKEAVKEKYRFFSFGDAMLILGSNQLIKKEEK